jgi:hypothetical protein
MSEQLQQFIGVAGFGALCFGCGYLIAFMVTRNKWRDEMIKRGVARYNWHTGKWEWGQPPRKRYRLPRPSMPLLVSRLECRRSLRRRLSNCLADVVRHVADVLNGFNRSTG